MATLKHILLPLLLFLVHNTFSLRIRNHWSPSDETESFFKIIGKFGFQQTDPLHLLQTRGYVYGNITLDEFRSIKTNYFVTMILVNYAHFRQMFNILKRPRNIAVVLDELCSSVMSVIDNVAFDPRCNPTGSQDVFRRVPCPRGLLCPDEDQPNNVFRGSQFTYRVQDKAQARYWYLILLDCRLNSNCTWSRNSDVWNSSRIDSNDINEKIDNLRINYDLYLFNGHPANRSAWNLFDHAHFSSDEQGLAELKFVALAFSCLLLALQLRAFALQRTERARFLLAILAAQVFQLSASLLHFWRFARDGVGVRLLDDFSSNFLTHSVEYLIVLLLILIAKGWKIRTNIIKQRAKTAVLFTVIFVCHLFFYWWALLTEEWWLDSCIFDVWQGWAILVVRILAMSWFFVELRRSVKLEVSECKQIFFLHFGSGFLVWFVYLPILGVFSSKIPLMSRRKTIEGLTNLANFVVLAVLTHLFYPKSANRLYFLNPLADQDDEEDGLALVEIEDHLVVENRQEKFVPINGKCDVLMDDLDNVVKITDCSHTY